MDKITGYLMNKSTGGMIGVNDYGLEIAELYEQKKGISEIAEKLINNGRNDNDRGKVKKITSDFINQMKNKGLNQENLRVIKKKDGHQLLMAQLDLSWKCNLRCKHCYLGDKTLLRNPLTNDEWKNIINQLYSMQVPKIAFLGGEPTMAVNFFELAEYASSCGFKIFSTTNATLATMSIAKRIMAAGFTEMDVSLDGLTEYSHEFIRGKGTFQKTIRGIQYLVKSGLKVKTATILMNSRI